jgi:aldehyde dehydrogenase (NAD+)
MSGQATIEQTLRELGIDPAQPHSGANHGKNHWEATTGPELVIHCPTNGLKIGSVRQATKSDYEATSALAAKTWETWRSVPAPARGEIVRQLGDELRRLKEPLGRLVSLEAGKVTSEGLGEVQEMIDICDFAVGLARTVGGCTMPSEVNKEGGGEIINFNTNIYY